MNIRSVLAASLLVLGFTAKADYLLWQINQNGQDNPVEFAYAKLVVMGDGVDEGTYLLQEGGDYAIGHSTFPVPESGFETLASYADLGQYGSSGYSFAVELYAFENDSDTATLVGISDYVSYTEMKNQFVYSNMSLTGVDPYVYRTFAKPTPEPTSGLMLLLGLGMLALRRKRVCACAMAAAVGLGASAASNDTLLSFSTPGADTYADGSRVLDGECYAIVWTPEGQTFGGLSSEARPVSGADRLVLIAPVAKSGRCPVTVLEIEAASASQYDGGTFGLYLLDTRIRTAEGKVVLAPFKDGAPQLVNALGVAAEETTESADAKGHGITAASAVKLGSVGVHTQIDAPKITAIRIDNATVTLTVDRMSPAADYFVVPGSRPGESAPALDAKAKDGTFTFPKPEGAPFFKVIGTRRF